MTESTPLTVKVTFSSKRLNKSPLVVPITLNSNNTISDLKKSLIECAERIYEEENGDVKEIILPDEMIDITLDNMKLYSGDPPELLTNSSDDLRLSEVNIHSDDIITVKKMPDMKITIKDEGPPYLSIRLRCKVDGENVTFEELGCNRSLGDLRTLLCDEMKKRKKDINLKNNNIIFLCGYPPKPLPNQTDSLKLYEANIQSGDTLIVKLESPTKILSDSSVMRRQEVPSNNSCLFASLYFIVCEGNVDVDDEEFLVNSNDLRAMVACKINEDPEKYNFAILGMPHYEYIEWILNTSNWGGYIELVILSDYFQFEIVAIDVKSSIPHRFGEDRNYLKRVFLLYNGIHYDPLFMGDERHKQTLFLASDPAPWDKALELAKIAKSQGEFTDLANCKLTCNICNIGLLGEREATQHAMDTGHSNFKEL